MLLLLSLSSRNQDLLWPHLIHSHTSMYYEDHRSFQIIPASQYRCYVLPGSNFDRQKMIIFFCRTKLSLEFRASNPNGILLYTAFQPVQSDFIECHLEEGRVSCSFSAGLGILSLTSPQASYSDGKWHTVSLIIPFILGIPLYWTFKRDFIQNPTDQFSTKMKFFNFRYKS